MKKIILIALCLVSAGANAAGMAGADPLLLKGMLNHLEYNDNSDGETAMHWDAEAWLGHDINKLWFKSDGERHEGVVEEHRVQLLYNRAVLPYWDVQLGIAHDTEESPSENWLATGFHGTAPYFIYTEFELYLGEGGYSTLDMKFFQEWMFTQRLALEPELNVRANGKTAEQYGVGSGLSQVEVSLRLHYEIRREFAPYIGVSGHRFFGETEDLLNDKGGTSIVAGISAWF